MGAVRRLAVVVVLVGAAALPGPAASAAEGLPGATYTALPAPTRILDTRTQVGGHPRPVGSGETVAVAVPGVPADATAVVINLTGTGPSAPTYLSAFPDRFVGTSTLNLAQGQTAAVAAFVTLGSGRTIRILNHNGIVDVVVDLVGYFATGAGPGFAPAWSPFRILDTRTSVGGHPRPLGQGEVLTLPVRGNAVPSDATAVIVNLTGVNPTAATYLTASPEGGRATSTLNVDPGAVRANLAVVGVGRDGAIRIFNHAGSVHVVADVQGWFGPDHRGRYMALPAPHRVLDTRLDNTPLGAGTTRTVSFGGSGVPSNGIVTTLFNLTGTEPTAGTYLTAWPRGQERPPTSNVNLAAGTTVPNAALSFTSEMEVFNQNGATHIVVDAAGYFYTPSVDNPNIPSSPMQTRARPMGDDRLRVEWEPPFTDGGVPITGYTVTVQPGGLTRTVDDRQRVTEFTGLAPGVYQVGVTATNLIGTGRPWDPLPWGLVSPMVRVDTDPSGAPDPADGDLVQGVSETGRYMLLSVRPSSTLVPPAHRDPAGGASYLLRKDMQTGEIVLVSLAENGSPMRSLSNARMSGDGRVFAYSSAPLEGPAILHVHDLAAGTVRTIPAPDGRGASALGLSADGHRLTWRSSTGTNGRALHRTDLRTGQTTALLDCPDPATGCYVSGEPKVSNDGRTLVLEYSPTPNDRNVIAVLDADTGELRGIPGTDSGRSATLSGDGNWIFYSLASNPYVVMKIANVPGATPVVLRNWYNVEGTAVVTPTSASYDGTLVGIDRQSFQAGRWYGASPAYVYDQVTGREIKLPDARDPAYLGGPPIITPDGSKVVSEERCLPSAECYPWATYVMSLAPLRTS